jgi:hypothetical protein
LVESPLSPDIKVLALAYTQHKVTEKKRNQPLFPVHKKSLLIAEGHIQPHLQTEKERLRRSFVEKAAPLAAGHFQLHLQTEKERLRRSFAEKTASLAEGHIQLPALTEKERPQLPFAEKTALGKKKGNYASHLPQRHHILEQITLGKNSLSTPLSSSLKIYS